jgi:hypothetical protein
MEVRPQYGAEFLGNLSKRQLARQRRKPFRLLERQPLPSGEWVWL